MDFLRNSFIFLSILPFFPFLLVYLGGYYWRKNTRNRALLLAMDVTTLFLIFSVAALFNNTFHTRFGFYLILLFMLIAVGLIGGAQNRLKGRIDARKIAKVVWRMSFMLMSASYIIFTLIGIFKYIIQTGA
ncbi:hypothetical protein FHS19_002000 [Paenibacillus rhizosphaerae]|uniref:DUF3397 domain-containing protein n=1 Tax=Paenibacillus rhizosphaerae TaxID=297318 RepID=A0A839TKP4_9BACL|nr:DUF3397 domain-containing protein [Paenibacillus rhizosphaerae]MBB3127346.1 hypothetical protein [Paenibacillus rhizosphaerae]